MRKKYFITMYSLDGFGGPGQGTRSVGVSRTVGGELYFTAGLGLDRGNLLASFTDNCKEVNCKRYNILIIVYCRANFRSRANLTV